MDLLKAILQTHYHYGRAEVNEIIDKAKDVTELKNLYDIAIIKLCEEKQKNISPPTLSIFELGIFCL